MRSSTPDAVPRHQQASPSMLDLREVLSESGIDLTSDRVRAVLAAAAAMSEDTLVNTLARAAKDNTSPFAVLARVTTVIARAGFVPSRWHVCTQTYMIFRFCCVCTRIGGRRPELWGQLQLLTPFQLLDWFFRRSSSPRRLLCVCCV
jgi:hypothetical protein